jgi:hypothetical protein
LNFILSKNPIITIHKKPDELTKVKNFERKRDKFFNFFKFKKEEKKQTLKIFKNENKILKGL